MRKILTSLVIIFFPLVAWASVLGIQQGGTALQYPLFGFQSGACLTGNGLSAIGTTTCGGGGGTGNVSTSSVPVIGGLSYWTTSGQTPEKLGTVATTSASCTGTVSCSAFTVIGASPITINGAAGTSASSTLYADNGSFTGRDTFTNASTTLLTLLGNLYDVNNSKGTNGYVLMSTAAGTIWSATTTFNTGLTYSAGNVTCDTSSATVFGCLTAASFSKFNSATTTFSSPLSYSGATNAVTCPTCNTSSATVSSIATTWPVIGGTITTTGTLSFGGLSTSSPIAAGASILYATGVNTIASVATSTISASGGITTTNGSFVIGSGLTIGCTVASASTPGCLQAVDFSKFNSATTTFGNGLTYSAGVASFDVTKEVNNTLQIWNGTQLQATGTPSLTIGYLIGTSTASSSLAGPISFTYASSTATSTMAGINLPYGGCFAVAGTCVGGGSGSGTVTSVATNNGLTGGTITTSGTLGLDTTAIVNGLLLQYNGTRLAATGTQALTAGYLIATTTSATSTFAGSVNLNNGGVIYDNTTGSTTISSLVVGNLNFDNDAGVVQWVDLPIVSAAANTIESYTASFNSGVIPDLTVWCIRTSSGWCNTPRVGIGTTTPSAVLTVFATSTSDDLFLVANNASTTLYKIDVNGHMTASSTAPTLSSGQIDGTDNGGIVTNCTSACTITFAKAWSKTPECNVTEDSGSVVNTLTIARSTTALTVTQTSLGTFSFHCGIGI